jgi:hypothetical protein
MSNHNLHELRMRAIETAQTGEIGPETEFQFTQENLVVTASYKGGKVRVGFLVGKLLGNKLEFRYCQMNHEGTLDSGISNCDLETTTAGKLRIYEHFSWESRGTTGTNILEEV